MHDIDPYDPAESTYECPSCGDRAPEPGECETCATSLRNISVPRE